MGQSRASQISTKDTPYYHITSHVVRNNLLCGINSINNIDYGSRKQWVIDRIKFLSSFFAIDVAGYSIEVDEYHMVIYINEAITKSWSIDEVYDHWSAIYNPKPILKRWKNKELIEASEIQMALTMLEECRNKLSNISLFMQNLNQYIARRANKEDGCKGHFWEGRFKSYALLDETALVTCMSHLDLNHVIEKEPDLVEEPEFRSIYERTHGYLNKNENFIKKSEEIKPLISFLGNDATTHISKNKIIQTDEPVINIKLNDYLELLDWTNKIQQDEEIICIETEKPGLLIELGFSVEDWIELANDFGNEFKCAVGTIAELEDYSINTGKNRITKKRRLGDLFH